MHRLKIPTHNRTGKVIILMCVLMMINFLFPLQFLGEYSRWTYFLYLGVGLAAIAYTIWGFVYQRMHFWAAALFAITLFTIPFNLLQLKKSVIYRCKMETAIAMQCSLVYVKDDWRSSTDGWVWYLTIEHFPLGIRTEYHPSDNFVLNGMLF